MKKKNIFSVDAREIKIDDSNNDIDTINNDIKTFIKENVKDRQVFIFNINTVNKNILHVVIHKKAVTIYYGKNSNNIELNELYDFYNSGKISSDDFIEVGFTVYNSEIFDIKNIIKEYFYVKPMQCLPLVSILENIGE